MVNNNEFDLRFKVNLQGIIELLSNHLYSSQGLYKGCFKMQWMQSCKKKKR